MDISSGKVETRFMEFVQMTVGPHALWAIFNRKSSGLLGTVEWYAPWRQYCYMPEGDTVMNKDCLESIMELLATLNKTAKQAAHA